MRPDQRRSNLERFEEKMGPPDADGCRPYLGGHSPKGYGIFMWREGGDSSEVRSIGAHVASYQLFHGRIPAGKVVQHLCNHPGCIQPGHLQAGTQLQNLAYMTQCGRSLHGERQHLAKLTDAEVQNLRSRYAAGETQVALAAAFSVSQPTVSHIIRHETWTHLAGRSQGAFSRLTPADIQAIQARRAVGETQEAIAKAFNVSQPTVSRLTRKGS